MNLNIRISIITVVRNNETGITETINSVLRQNYTNLQYVIKDGLSTDNTCKLIEAAIEETDRDVVFISNQDIGLYDAMNQAVELCDGEWVLFLNSGDRFWSDDVISEAVEILTHKKDIDILYGDAIVNDNEEKSIWKADISKYPYRMAFNHNSSFARTSIIKDKKFDTQFKIAADYNFLLQCFLEKKTFFDSGIRMVEFFLDGVSSTKFISSEKERYLVVKHNGLLTVKYVLSYPLRLCMAMIKEVMSRMFHQQALRSLTAIYKKRIKRYEPYTIHNAN